MAKPTTSESLNPATLKFYREKAELTRRGLAERSKRLAEQSKDDKSSISETTIYRWEHGQQTKNVQTGSRKALERALGVRWEVLTRPPKEDDISSIRDRLPLKAGIAGSARTALTVMQLRYGLLEEAILDLAPLAFLILAEKSLQARKAALKETEQEIEAVTENVHQRHPYMRDTYFSDKDWIATERKSLDKREVYEQYIDDEGAEMSPFVDFLEKELKTLKKELKTLDKFQKYPIAFSSSYRSAPDYAIPVEIIAPIVGLDANDEAGQRVLELIQEGSIDLWQALEKKKEATEEAYLAWLEEQRQEIEDALERQRSEFFSSLKLDLDLGFTPNTSEGATPEQEDQA